MRITPTLLLAGLLLAPLSAAAQEPVLPTSRLGFAHDGVDTDRYELRVDQGLWVTVEVQEADGVYSVAMPALTPGEHTLALRACGAAGCSVSSTALAVRMVVVPSPPTELRIVPVAAPDGGGGGEVRR